MYLRELVTLPPSRLFTLLLMDLDRKRKVFVSLRQAGWLTAPPGAVAGSLCWPMSSWPLDRLPVLQSLQQLTAG